MEQRTLLLFPSGSSSISSTSSPSSSSSAFSSGNSPSPSSCCSSRHPPPAKNRCRPPATEPSPVFFCPLLVPRYCRSSPGWESQQQQQQSSSSSSSVSPSPFPTGSSPPSAADTAAAAARASSTGGPLPKRPKIAQAEDIGRNAVPAFCGGQQQQQQALTAPQTHAGAATGGKAGRPPPAEQQQAAKAALTSQQQRPSTAGTAAGAALSAASAAAAEAAVTEAAAAAATEAPVGGAPAAVAAGVSAAAARNMLEDVRVLVVGAGGIGCELCKDLVLSGFCRICVVDLDTVDMSNLNRQFFFRQEHVGQSKAAVLAEACNRLLPPARRAALQQLRRAALKRRHGHVPQPSEQQPALLQQQQQEADDLGRRLQPQNRHVLTEAGTKIPGAEGEEEGRRGEAATAAAKGEDEGIDRAEGAAREQAPSDADAYSSTLWDIEGDTVYGVVGRVLNILTPAFDVELLQGYDAVVSALDNRRARRHLNALCVAAGIPLIEGGSTGYAGQVTPILKGETLCYDCEEKPREQQRIPVCTLRQRPERPEHCIAWSKMIYELLFGVESSDNLLSDLQQQLQALVEAVPPQHGEESLQPQPETAPDDERPRRASEEPQGSGEQTHGTAQQLVAKESPQQRRKQQNGRQVDGIPRPQQQQQATMVDQRQQRENRAEDHATTLALSRRIMKELFCDQIQQLLQLAAEGKDGSSGAANPWGGRAPPRPLCIRGPVTLREAQTTGSNSCLETAAHCSSTEGDSSKCEMEMRGPLCDVVVDGSSGNSSRKTDNRGAGAGVPAASAAHPKDSASATTFLGGYSSISTTGGTSPCSSSSSTNGYGSESCGRRSSGASGAGQLHLESQRVWTVEECQQTFEHSFEQLLRRRRRAQAAAAQTTRTSKKADGIKGGGIPFDKDDSVAMEFVTAAANLRMHNFHIPLKSLWDAQAIAGAIVPAIASTNAMVAALQVVQLLHMLDYLRNTKTPSEAGVEGEDGLATLNSDAPEATAEKQWSTLVDSRCRYVWVKPYVTGLRPHLAGRVILPETLDPPKPACFVCQQQTVTVQLASLQVWTLGTFVDEVVKGELGLANPYLDCGCRNLFDPDEVAGNDLLLKQHLTQFDVRNGSIITATDFSRGNLQFDLLLQEKPELALKSVNDKWAISILRDADVTSAGRPQDESSAQSDTLKTVTLAGLDNGAQQQAGGSQDTVPPDIDQQEGANLLDSVEGKPPKRTRREQPTTPQSAPSNAGEGESNDDDDVVLDSVEVLAGHHDTGRGAFCVTVVDDD